ncbi:MAG: RHS domain-containing protein [Acidobacteria bacterium]|nr:RHS domain-containing protein [Acidobacteriota bacterium]
MNLLSETEYTDASAPPIQHDYVWFAGAPVAQVTHSVPSEPLAVPEVVWTVTDHLGTPRIQTDSTGTIVWHAEHEPYGRIYLLREGEGRHQPLRFPGQEAEQLGMNAPNGVTDRNYNIFRWYRAAEGRYTQADPLGLEAGAHLFVYGAWSPASMIDPLGLVTWKCDVEVFSAGFVAVGVADYDLFCVSACYKGKQIWVDLNVHVIGFSFGTPSGGYFSIVLDDHFEKPNPTSLSGKAFVKSLAASLGGGWSHVEMTLGSGEGMTPSAGSGLGSGGGEGAAAVGASFDVMWGNSMLTKWGEWCCP